MTANLDLRSGRVQVDCPYCLIGPWGTRVGGFKNEVDVTKFAEHEGKREHTVTCSKGHTLHFRTVAEWREGRQKQGLQEK
jgi:hypothetical protein